MKSPKVRETDIGIAAKRYLESHGWEVYPEVQLNASGGIADIVAVKDDVIWVVECKMRVTLALLKQLWRWRKYANMLSVAVLAGSLYPQHLARLHGEKDFQGAMLDKFGFGCFGVLVNPPRIESLLSGAGFERERDDFLHVIRDQHRDSAPGQVEGKRFTALDSTLANLVEYVRGHPGVALREAVSQIRHHCKDNRSAAGTVRQHLKPYKENSRCPEIILVPRHGRLCCDVVDLEVM